MVRNLMNQKTVLLGTPVVTCLNKKRLIKLSAFMKYTNSNPVAAKCFTFPFVLLFYFFLHLNVKLFQTTGFEFGMHFALTLGYNQPNIVKKILRLIIYA